MPPYLNKQIPPLPQKCTLSRLYHILIWIKFPFPIKLSFVTFELWVKILSPNLADDVRNNFHAKVWRNISKENIVKNWFGAWDYFLFQKQVLLISYQSWLNACMRLRCTCSQIRNDNWVISIGLTHTRV